MAFYRKRNALCPSTPAAALYPVSNAEDPVIKSVSSILHEFYLLFQFNSPLIDSYQIIIQMRPEITSYFICLFIFATDDEFAQLQCTNSMCTSTDDIPSWQGHTSRISPQSECSFSGLPSEPDSLETNLSTWPIPSLS